jgi:rhodanese-related sulfurtransferase
MPERIGLGELKRLLGERAQLIDVVGPREYANEHLPGVINIPLSRLASETTAQLGHRKPIAVYCHDALASGTRSDTRSAQAPAAASPHEAAYVSHGLAHGEYPRLSPGRQAAVPGAGQVHPGCRTRGMIPA